jgi:hypothetical protein
MKKIFLLMTLLLAFSTFVSATPGRRTPGVNNRQQKQQKSIRQGVRSGELTFKEWAKLEKQQFQIHKAERRAKSDGVVTFGERIRLHQKQNQARQNIYNQKHDGQDR